MFLQSLTHIMDASMEDLARCPGIGERKVFELFCKHIHKMCFWILFISQFGVLKFGKSLVYVLNL